MSGDVVARAKYCREWGNFDNMHGELLAEVEKLRGALETIRGIARDNRHHHAFRRVIDFIELGIEP